MAQMTRPRLKLQSLNALVQEVLELQSEELVRRRVRLLKRLSPDVPSLLIDNDKMRQVLLNIVQHALQSVPSGGRVASRPGPAESFTPRSRTTGPRSPASLDPPLRSLPLLPEIRRGWPRGGLPDRAGARR
jgi:hypothetical protein